jgi:hypothetical protein
MYTSDERKFLLLLLAGIYDADYHAYENEDAPDFAKERNCTEK